MKQFFVTTGIGLSYHNDFDVRIYNIQKPTKETVLSDYTLDYLNKVIEFRKLQSKKKPEKNLAALVNQITSETQAKQQVDQKSIVQKLNANTSKPARVFKMPYPITATCYKTSDEEQQLLAVGLLDGAVVVIDLVLGIEKYFIEKHPSAVTSIAIYEN